MIGIDKALWHGMYFILERIAGAAKSELEDVSSLRRQLIAAQTQFDAGELSLEELTAVESLCLRRHRVLRGTAAPIQGARVQIEILGTESSPAKSHGKAPSGRDVR